MSATAAARLKTRHSWPLPCGAWRGTRDLGEEMVYAGDSAAARRRPLARNTLPWHRWRARRRAAAQRAASQRRRAGRYQSTDLRWRGKYGPMSCNSARAAWRRLATPARMAISMYSTARIAKNLPDVVTKESASRRAASKPTVSIAGV